MFGHHSWGLVAASALVVAIPVAPVAAAESDVDPGDLIAAMKGSAQLKVSESDWEPSAFAVGRPLPSGSIGANTLVRKKDYWVFDAQTDKVGDSWTIPELVTAGLAVRKDRPQTLMLAATTDPATYPTDTFGVLLDVSGDGVTDFGAVTVGSMTIGTVYSTQLYRFVGDQPRATGRNVMVMRANNGYVLGIDAWRSLGMVRVSYVAALSDGTNSDYAPDAYAAAVPVGSLVPTVTAAPGKVTGLKVRPKRTKATVVWTRTRRASWYRVQLVAGRNVITKRFKGTACLVKHLKPGKRYTVRVRAGNAVGIGPVSSKRFRALT